MAKSDFQKAESQLQIDAEYYNTLDIGGFSRMLKDPSYCYKFYWLEAIIQTGTRLPMMKLSMR